MVEGMDRMRRGNRKHTRLICGLLLLLAVICAAGALYTALFPGATETVSDGLVVHFIDVGQGDAALVRCGEAAMLIDAGTNESGGDVLRYLQEHGVQNLDYAVATHPHEDHIGGMDTVVLGVQTRRLLMPETDAATATWKDVLSAAAQSRAEQQAVAAGDRFALGDAQVEVVGPVKTYSDTNDQSVVLRIVYGDTSFLFTGDAERLSEKDMVESGAQLSCDVLKTGHHGSNTSSGYLFLRAANPKYAVISCGQNNDYGHPHEEVLSRLGDLGAEVFRTDLLGTIVASSDGREVRFDRSGVKSERPHSGEEEAGLAGNGEIIAAAWIGNRKSLIYHLPSCTSLPAEQNRIAFASAEDAERAGYRPCANCVGSR